VSHTLDPALWASYGPLDGCVPLWRFIVGVITVPIGYLVIVFADDKVKWRPQWAGPLLFLGGSLIWLTGHVDCKADYKDGQERDSQDQVSHPGSVAPPILDAITDVVLAYHPKPKTKAAKRRIRRARRAKQKALGK
jgi:hypothetical protein